MKIRRLTWLIGLLISFKAVFVILIEMKNHLVQSRIVTACAKKKERTVTINFKDVLWGTVVESTVKYDILRKWNGMYWCDLLSFSSSRNRLTQQSSHNVGKFTSFFFTPWFEQTQTEMFSDPFDVHAEYRSNDFLVWTEKDKSTS